MEKTRFYFLIRFNPTDQSRKHGGWWGERVVYVQNVQPRARRAAWNTTADRHQAEKFSNLSDAKRVLKARGLDHERETMNAEIVRVQVYEEICTIFPEPNIAEQLAQIELS